MTGEGRSPTTLLRRVKERRGWPAFAGHDTGARHRGLSAAAKSRSFGRLVSAEQAAFRAGVPSGTLRQHQQAGHHEHRDTRRDQRSADIEAAGVNGFVEQIAERRAQGAGQDEGGPEQRHPRGIRPGVQRRQQDQQSDEQRCAAAEAKAGNVRRPVAQRGAERLREGDGGPVEGLRISDCPRLRRRSCLSSNTRGRAWSSGRRKSPASHRCSQCPANGRRSLPWSCRTGWRRRSWPNRGRDEISLPGSAR